MQIFLIHRFNLYCPSFIFKTTEQNAKNIYYLYHGYQFDDEGRRRALKLLLMPQHKLSTEGVTSLTMLSTKFQMLYKRKAKPFKPTSYLFKQCKFRTLTKYKHHE